MSLRRLLPTHKQPDRQNDENVPIRSGRDAKLQADLLLRQRCARLSDAASVIGTTLNKILDETSNKISSQAKRGIADLKKTVLPMMLTAAADEMPKSIQKLAAIPASQYIHRTNETLAKRESNLPKRRKKMPALVRINATLKEQQQKKMPAKRHPFVAQVPDPGKTNDPVNLLPPRKTKPRTLSAGQKEVRLPRAPPPENGIYYTAVECVTYLKVLNPTTRSRMIKRWVDMKLVPANRAAIYRRLKEEADGKPVKEFGVRGRNFMLNKDQIRNIAEYLDARHGKAFTLDHLRDAIAKETANKIHGKGRVPLQSTTPCKTTIKNYMAKVAEHPKVSIASTTIPKTSSRIIAENSLISAMSLVVAVAATHWNPTLEPQWSVERNLKERATAGAQKMYSLLKNFYGASVHLRPAHPACVLSMDDTVQYIFEGEGESKDSFVLVGVSSNTGRHTHATYSQNNSKHMTGLRVKLTYTFTATGLQAPVFVTISGLTADELPINTCPSGILHLDVEGLSVAGGGVQLGASARGSIVFIRNDGDQEKDKKRVRYYRDKVLFPFVDEIRRQFLSWEPGYPIPENMAVQSWCDGDNAQIASIIDTESVRRYAEKAINAIKQNAARTGVEQPADLCRVFPNMTALHKKVTLANIDAELHPLKLSLTREFNHLTSERILNLPSNKRNALIDFLALLPETMQQACTRRGIIHGFQANGMIDKYVENGKVVSSRFPDFDKMLATCQTNPTNEDYDLCVSSFPYLLQYFLDYGHIPDLEYEKLGFKVDVDPEGNEMRREAGIENESRQRVKLLTHKFQIQLRKERLAAIAAEAARKVADSHKKTAALLDLNKKCEAIIKADGGDLIQGTLEHLKTKFRALKNDLCRAFLCVRDKSILVSKLPKKGKLDDVVGGPPNLVRIVHGFRTKPIVVSMSDDDDEEIVFGSDNLPDNQFVAPEPATVIPVLLQRGSYLCEEQASKILECSAWLDAVRVDFVTEGQELVEVDDDVKCTANVLQKLLLQRLTSHVRHRVPDINTKKQGCNWVFQLVGTNMARLAALMCVQGHIKSDLLCMGEDKTLLANERHFATAFSNAGKKREGAYLYFDTNDTIHVRSGKVCGRPFSERHKEHKKAAREGDHHLFYSRYPSSQEVLTNTNQTRKGWFENLHQLIAVGFDSSSPSLDDGISKIFLFDADVVKKIERMSFGCNEHQISRQQKKRHMASYVCELTYDLAISVTDNVSTSPGFESCGLWGR